MKSKELNEKATKLINIKNKIEKLLNEAEELIKDTIEVNEELPYWICYIRRALSDDPEYVHAFCLIDDTIKSLLEKAEDLEFKEKDEEEVKVGNKMKEKQCPECKQETLMYNHDDPNNGGMDSAYCKNCSFSM